jgi:hypothetical protein
MIQRIQTLFLFGAVVSLLIMILFPVGEVVSDEGISYSLRTHGIYDDSGELFIPALPVVILAGITALLLLVNIFLFRNRKLQIRLCVYGIVLNFGLLGLIYYYGVLLGREVDKGELTLLLTVLMPVISIIFTYLAFRGIRKDEILIRSIDKLR